MPGPGLGYNVVSGPEWGRVIRALGRANDEAQGKFRDSIEDDAERLADVARGRVLSLPTPRHAGHTGLRAKVAEGVHVERQGTGGVRIQTSMPTASEGRIPRGLDSPKGWRHPLFGDKSNWFSNPGYDWFLSTFSHSGDAIESNLSKVLENIIEDIG